MSMTVDRVCEDIMSNWEIPLSRRLQLVREIRAKAKAGDDARNVIKQLAGLYMGDKWAKSTGANRLVGAYLGYLLSSKL